MNSTEIRVWMLRNNIRQTDIAKEARVKPASVFRVIEGRSKSKRIEQVLIKKGCPEDFLKAA